MRSEYYIPARSATHPYTVDITPTSAKWSESSLRVVQLTPDSGLTRNTGDTELMILPLAGGGIVECDGQDYELSYRASVFDGPADMVYVGTNNSFTIRGSGRFAMCGARARRQLPTRRVAAADVAVELRGAGRSSRQVHNFGTADTFEADSLIACEVITPGGNWSSYPAHKHDEESAVESCLEEIYYFEFTTGPGDAPGFGYHRVYGTPDRPIEVLEEVRTGDAVLVPHGFHGPSVAAPGYHMYYLNVMAGPGHERAWRIVDDPQHAWHATVGSINPSTPGSPFIRQKPSTHQKECDVVSTAPRSMQKAPDIEPTVRLTVAQATVRFLGKQFVERDGQRSKFFAGCFGIFGHGNVAGLGQALLQDEIAAAAIGSAPALPYVLGRNEQAMVHTAVAYARQKDRLQAWAVTASVGPGATNMLTGAALATINRIPVLLLPADTFATRVSAPVLQELELPSSGDVTVNDAFKPLSRYFDRVWRPEQLPAALLGAMRVLTDPADTGTATIAIPQDVQAESFDWPESLFAERTWHIARPVPERSIIGKAAAIIRNAKRPLIVAGGGVIYADASDVLADFASFTGIPVSQTQAGKGAVPYNHPQSVGAIGSTGTTAANALATEADVVIGIGTRYSDFTTASRTAFANADVRFVNINVAALDSTKNGGLSVVADAREALAALSIELADYSVDNEYRTKTADLASQWDSTVAAAYQIDDDAADLNQSKVIGLVNTLSNPRDVVVCAAGSMPGDLHKLWRTRDRKGYHVEYGYSCMGYEIAGGLGVKLAEPDRDVYIMVGDGSYLMMATELVTAVQEGIKVIVVLVQNHGFASIGSLSEALGSQRFGTAYRYRSSDGHLDGRKLPTDLAANAASLGAEVIRVSNAIEFSDAITVAKSSDVTTVIHVETDPLISAPDSESWWDVPVSEISELESTRAAYLTYVGWKQVQRPLLRPTDRTP